MIPFSKPSEGAVPTDSEREELIAFARKRLEYHGDLERFIETGELPSSLELGGGTHGPLRDARSNAFNRKMVALYRPTAEELESARRWHDFCAEHGYLLEGVDSTGYPPQPIHVEAAEQTWAVLTWAQVRKALSADSEPQMTLILNTEKQVAR